MSEFLKRLLQRLGGVVCVGGYEIPVVIEKLSDASGEYHDHVQLIKLDNQQTEQCAINSLIHEVLHAIDAQYDLGLTHKAIYTLSAGLAQALRPLLLEGSKKIPL